MRKYTHTASVLLISLICLLPSCNTFLAGGSAATPIPPQDGIDPNHPNIERTTKQVDFTDIRTIRVEIPNGQVLISQSKPSGQAIATIQATKTIEKGGLGNDILEQFLTESEITIDRSFVDDTRLDVAATVTDGLADPDIVFNLRLVVPDGVNIEVLVGKGPVEVDNLTGNVEIKTHEGAVSVKGIDGNVSAQTTQESITVADVTGNVEVKTEDGDIALQLSPGPDDRISANTSAGMIRLTIGSTAAAKLSLTSNDGTVTADLKGFAVTNISTGKGFLEGILNGGGGEIIAKTTQGEIKFQSL